MKTLPILQPVHVDGQFRYFAFHVPDNGCYIQKLVIIAMPDQTDEQPKIIGQLVVIDPMPESLGENGPIDWIEVIPEHRQGGVGRAMCAIAEKLCGHPLDHDPATSLGTKFARAMTKNPLVELICPRCGAIEQGSPLDAGRECMNVQHDDNGAPCGALFEVRKK